MTTPFCPTRPDPHTIWQNYRLIGVQGRSVDCPGKTHDQVVQQKIKSCPPKVSVFGLMCRANAEDNTPSSRVTCVQYQNQNQCVSLDPNYYMANFVIESDPALNSFSGPGFGGAPFGTCQNTVYNGQLFNNGDCKGCHAVAQSAFGTDFSFLLDVGHNKPAVEPDTINQYPRPAEGGQAAFQEAMKAVRDLKNYLD